MLDGKGHVTKYGNTWSIKPTGPNSWESTTKRDGKVTATSKWTVSEDGKTFTTMDENMRPDGSTARRKATLSGPPAPPDWLAPGKGVSKDHVPALLEVAKWQGDGYSVRIRPTKSTRISSSTAKNTLPTGRVVPKGTTVSASKIDDHNMELTYKLKGKTTETDRWELSADGKTLTQPDLPRSEQIRR